VLSPSILNSPHGQSPWRVQSHWRNGSECRFIHGNSVCRTTYGQPPSEGPQPLKSNAKTIQETGIPTSCSQFIATAPPSKIVSSHFYSFISQTQRDANSTNSTTLTFGEDCLNLNVERSANATANSKLPVVFWIFGGGFELGSTQSYDATQLINTSVAQGKDIIYVAANYRVGGFGFMPWKEVLADGSANLGLLDQRLALQASRFLLRLSLNPYPTTLSRLL
jgi:acetylcholinesterase